MITQTVLDHNLKSTETVLRGKSIQEIFIDTRLLKLSTSAPEQVNWNNSLRENLYHFT